MTERIKELRRFFVENKHHLTHRKQAIDPLLPALSFQRDKMPDMDRAVARLKYMLDNETPVVFENERIALTRTIPKPPALFTDTELDFISTKYRLHEKGEVCNINVDYSMLLDTGFDAKREEINTVMEGFRKKKDTDAVRYLEQLLIILDSVEKLADKYRKEAEKTGNTVVAESFAQIPAKPPTSFLQALQMLRLLHFTMWCGNNYHNTLGRFDQYMLKYLRNDMNRCILDYDDALELVEEFFSIR